MDGEGVIMDIIHLHLMLNHVPVIGVIAGLIILAWGIFRRSEEVKTVGLLALIVTAVIALPVYLTGEPAEEIVEKLAGVSESVIEWHEHSATLSLIFVMVTGGLALVSLVLRRLRFPGIATAAIAATLLLSAGTSILMARTANLGGQIRHSEIRAAAATGETQTQRGEGRQDRDRDDD